MSSPETRTLTLPWTVLRRDNDRHGLMKVQGHPRIVLTSAYRKAKEAARLLVSSQWKGPPLVGPVVLTVVLHEPDKRRRDVLNYSKMLCDALSLIAILDDHQIDEAIVTRGERDPYNPRADITLTPRPADG